MKIFGAICSKHPELNGLRYESSTCVKCNSEYAMQWIKDHPERSPVKKWKAANKDKVSELAKDYYRRTKEDRLKVSRAWKSANPQKVAAMDRRRRASKYQAIPKWANHFFIEEIYDLCRLRTKLTGYKWHVDHIVPLKSPLVCGLHVEHNLQVIPARLNQEKHNRYWPDMPQG